MPKVAQDVLEEFGKAVKRARSLKGWQLDQLSSVMEGSNASRSYLSNLEKGKRQISPPTVGKLIKALDLDEAWIDRFLDADVAPEAEETPQDHETGRLIRLKDKDPSAPEVSEDLLILLANTHAEGNHTDTFTAYTALKAALEAADRIRQRGQMPDNTGGQLQAVMAEVAQLNETGAVDEADALLDAEEKRMRAAHRAQKDRQDAEASALLDRRLDQDRLRNDSKAAADRLITDLRARPDRGKLFLAIDSLSGEWRERGDQKGDIFALRVALALARINWERSKNKRGLAAAALRTLGVSYLRLAERSTNPGDLNTAHKALKASVDKTSKSKEPLSWALRMDGLGHALLEMGERAADPDVLRAAVTAQREALAVALKHDPEGDLKYLWNNLGNALQALGEVTRDAEVATEAVDALRHALSLLDQSADPLDCESTQNNLAVALRWQGALTRDSARLQQARDGYAACEARNLRDQAPFKWARVQWNIADLALARHALDPDPAFLEQAETHVRRAREVFVDGSDYQTERCDELLARIADARAVQDRPHPKP